MNSILGAGVINERAGFWARQTAAERTSGQLVFDIVFGILMPLVCFYLDPGIIKGAFHSTLGEWSMFIYGFSGLAILTMFTWLVWGHRQHRLRATFGGVLIAGAAISASIGVLILPLTLIGLLLVIGLLGFVPFITSFVYLRNGLSAVNHSGDRSPRIAAVLLSAVLAIGLPVAAQRAAIVVVEHSVAEILNPSSQEFDASVARIRRLRSVVDTDRFVRLYENESNTERKERLARAYKEITGLDIERRLMILND